MAYNGTESKTLGSLATMEPPPAPPPLRYVNDDRRPEKRPKNQATMEPPPTSETIFDFDTRYDIGMPMIILIVFIVGAMVGKAF